MNYQLLRTILAASATLVLCAGPSAANSQQIEQTDQCYRFDRAYFHWVGRPPGIGRVFVDSTAIIRLGSAGHADLPDRFVLEPPAMDVDTFTMRRWLGRSGWRPQSADSIEVSWFNGLYGPLFRLAVRGDSLDGRVRFLTDVVGAEPPPEPASAIRIACRSQ